MYYYTFRKGPVEIACRTCSYVYRFVRYAVSLLSAYRSSELLLIQALFFLAFLTFFMVDLLLQKSFHSHWKCYFLRHHHVRLMVGLLVGWLVRWSVCHDVM